MRCLSGGTRREQFHATVPEGLHLSVLRPRADHDSRQLAALPDPRGRSVTLDREEAVVTTQKLDGPEPPAWMAAFDGGEWTWYVLGHDPADLIACDEPDMLDFERLWMRPIRASQVEDYGLSDDDPDDHVLRDPKTGRFTARICWMECGEDAPQAVAYMGARYKRGL